jgi:hypothetical protein
MRLADPAFLEAVRWVVFAEQLMPDLVEARRTASTDPSEEVLKGGPRLVEFQARRAAARARILELEPVVYPADPEGDA